MRSLSISSDIWRRRGGRGRGGGRRERESSIQVMAAALGCSMNIFFLPRGAALLHGERDGTASLHRSIRTDFFVPLRSNNALQIAFLRASVIDHPYPSADIARWRLFSFLPVTRSLHIYHPPHTFAQPFPNSILF